MKKALFEELTDSVREAGHIHRGSRKATRRFVFKAEDVRAIRERLDKTQSEFAHMIGVTLSTLQNWEQGRRQPQGPARALLVVAEHEPALVANALAAAARSAPQVSRKRSTAPAGRSSAKRVHR